jgi:hypothetical protein
MPRRRRRRILVLLATAGTITTGAVIGDAFRGSDPAPAAAAGPPEVTLPNGIGALREGVKALPDRIELPPLSWQRSAPGSDGSDVITVRGSKCPQSHPHKVGSSSAGTWTQINGGKVEHRSSRRVRCAR